MSRLIDADALLEASKASLKYETNPKWSFDELQDLITNAPTVQREGWVSVPIEPTEKMMRNAEQKYISMREDKNKIYGYLSFLVEGYKAMLSAAPSDKE